MRLIVIIFIVTLYINYMKTLTIIAALTVFALPSCNPPTAEDKPKTETPKALEDESASYEIRSKRGSDDLVENLYGDLVDKTPELKALEYKIDNLYSSKDDSTKSFNRFDLKSLSYYSSAENHVEQIKDSLLKNKMKALIANSLSEYHSAISSHTAILKSIDTKYLALGDLHTMIKIIRTLPLIEKYQQDNLPTIKSLEGLSRHLDRTIKYADSISTQ